MSNLCVDISNGSCKRSISDMQETRKPVLNDITFVFQDETKTSVSLSLLKKYPKSILFLTYENNENHIDDEDAYYIDSPPLSINHLVALLEKSDLDNIYILENERSMTIHSVLSEEKKQLFMNYYEIFNLLNITNVTMKFDFNEDIPYEYIYPSNLHIIFPKLETYTLYAFYYGFEKKVCVSPADTHYSTLFNIYKSVKRIYKMGRNSIYRGDFINGEQYINNKYSLSLITNTNKDDIIHKTTQGKKNQSILVHYKHTYSRDYEPNVMNKEKLYFSICFSYIDSNKKTYFHSYDNPENYQLIINTRMYPEYIQLFEDIITTHVFPNVTTIEIDINNMFIDIILEIVSLITKNNFPRLHIYIVKTVNSIELNYEEGQDDMFNMKDIRFFVSFLNEEEEEENNIKDSFEMNKCVINKLCNYKNVSINKLVLNLNLISEYDSEGIYTQLFSIPSKDLYIVENKGKYNENRFISELFSLLSTKPQYHLCSFNFENVLNYESTIINKYDNQTSEAINKYFHSLSASIKTINISYLPFIRSLFTISDLVDLCFWDKVRYHNNNR
ncbi:hypothetical protein WA158_006333 [Blastocystis sp. Blastoise]